MGFNRIMVHNSAALQPTILEHLTVKFQALFSDEDITTYASLEQNMVSIRPTTWAKDRSGILKGVGQASAKQASAKQRLICLSCWEKFAPEDGNDELSKAYTLAQPCSA
jgi:hypothetical protein